MNESQIQRESFERPPDSIPIFNVEFTNEIWARLDSHASTEGSGHQHSVTIAAELPYSTALPQGIKAHRHVVELEESAAVVDIYNDCVRVYTGDHFAPDGRERYRVLRVDHLKGQSPFPENSYRRYIAPMRSIAVMTFDVEFENREMFTLHGLSHYCSMLMAACNQILEAERCTFSAMSWTFPYHLGFLSIGLYWVHIANNAGYSEARPFLGNSKMVALTPPYTSRESFESITSTLLPGQAYPMWWQYYCKAATLLGQESFRSAVLEGIIALEMALSLFVRKRLSERGVSKSRLSDVKRDLTLSLMLNIELVSLSPDNNKPNPELVGRLNSARKLRNDIVHDGKFQVSAEDATGALSAIREGLLYLAPFISSVRIR